MLVAEESLQKLIMNAENEDDKICVALNKRMGSVYVSMTLRGRAFELIQGDTVEDVLHIEQDVGRRSGLEMVSDRFYYTERLSRAQLARAAYHGYPLTR